MLEGKKSQGGQLASLLAFRFLERPGGEEDEVEAGAAAGELLRNEEAAEPSIRSEMRGEHARVGCAGNECQVSRHTE